MKTVHLFLFVAFVALLQSCYKEPIANFEYSYLESFSPAIVTFENLSTDADKFQWIFGDGETSNEKNPVHSYYQFVKPNVSMVANGRGGESEINKTLGITSYYVKNSYTSTLSNIKSFFLDGTSHVDEFSLGTIYSGYESVVVITHHDVIHVSFELGGVFYITDPGFELIENSLAYIEITGETTVMKSAPGFKGSSPLIKVKDLVAQ